jgi:hypothetical protein
MKDDNTKKGSGVEFFLQDFLPLSQLSYHSTSQSLSHLDYESQVLPIPGGIQTTDEKYWMTYREWRDQQKQSLRDFLTQRLTETNDEPEDQNDDNVEFENAKEVAAEEDSNDMDVHHTTTTQPETQPMLGTQPETQPMFHQPMIEEAEAAPLESPLNRPRRSTSRQKSVPHVNETLHDVFKLQYVDLYTQTLHLPLCRVIKVWNQRDTKRVGDETSQITRRLCPKFQHTSGAMSRVSFGHMEEDGPVASAYRTVLSMEVEQLKLVETSGPTTTSFPSCKKRRRIKLFFYNVYAEAVGKWICQQRKEKQTDFVMSLSHIPAICIFPRAINQDYWMELHDMVEYCVCIGDTSNARADGSFIRFDDDMFLIRMASQSILTNQDDVGEITTLPQELVISHWHCDSKGFSSSSEESKAVEGRANVVMSIQKVWSRFIRQQQHEKERQEKASDHPTVNHEQDLNFTENGSVGVGEHADITLPLAPMVVEGSATREQNDVNVEYVKLVSHCCTGSFFSPLPQYFW